jgi:hypothetical protein
METPLPPKLQLALDACRAVGWTITGEICFRWIGKDFKAKGVTHRDLAMLARRGYLRKTGEMRCAVYYRLADQRGTMAKTPRRSNASGSSSGMKFP